MMETNKCLVTHSVFVDACTRAGVKPSKRQAGRFKRRRGEVYKAAVEHGLLW
jgi:hypothetical protein